MQKFKTWLDKNPGMATRLKNVLSSALGHSVNATCISNVKHERRLAPTSWMPHIEKLSAGKVTINYLVVERNKLEKKLSGRM